MLQKYKKELLIASFFILLPCICGLVFSECRPLILSSLSLFAGQWLCFALTAADPGNRNRNEKPLRLVLWIMPAISLICAGIFLAGSLGISMSLERLLSVAFGILFAVIGNYLPKCRRNHTIGVKLPWTFASEENWNATHRFTGRLWVVGGMLAALSALLPRGWNLGVLFGSIALLSLVPVLYSYRFYRKQLRQGAKMQPLPAAPPMRTGIGAAAGILILIFILAVLFSGKVETSFQTDSFTVSGSFYGSTTVFYDRVEQVEYRDSDIPGSRVYGVGSFRLELGTFQNTEFGSYTRYTYYRPESCVVVHTGGKILVLSGRDSAQTQQIYRQLLERTLRT